MNLIKSFIWFILFLFYKATLFSKKFSRISAFLIIMGSPPINKLNSRNKVLVFNKTYGIDDIKAGLKIVNQKSNFLSTRRLFIRYLFYKYFQSEKKVPTLHYKYQNFISKNNSKIKKFEKHLTKIIFWLKKDFGVKAIFTFNITNFHERELYKACQENLINFVVAHKESIKSPSQFKIYGDAFKRDVKVSNFKNFHIGVYNKMEKDQMIRSGIPKNVIDLVGCPRIKFLDDTKDTKKLPSDINNINILLLDIYPQAGLPYLDREWCGEGDLFDWDNTYLQVLEILFITARKNTNFNLKIRSKGPKYQSFAVKEKIMNNSACFDDSKNLISKEFELSDYVIGLNSTSVIEALALGKVVICPAWTEIYNYHQLKEKGYLYDLEEAVVWAKSENQFSCLLESILLGNNEFINSDIKLRIDKANKFVNSYTNKERLAYGNWLRRVSI